MEIILHSDQFETLSKVHVHITLKMKEYHHKSNELEMAIEQLETLDEDVLEDQWNQIAPNAEHNEKQCADVSVSAAFKEMGSVQDAPPEAVELTQGLGVKPAQSKEDFVINMISDCEYYTLVQSLNKEQR